MGFVDGWHSFGLVLLGSVGFLDHFTIAASRFSQAVAVEDRDSFDDRFGASWPSSALPCATSLLRVRGIASRLNTAPGSRKYGNLADATPHSRA